ncbi:hypothetical protein R3W88_019358 [Solanum pinnatisectum]|uniref:Uncharacterized protein n=1 Tax=Solanum pinnatisectum TaxID=50273 RepID=A0AAV9KJP6_9SOLN|nr:hypothetical protein R3W88_019358 [Solanum pinnatisectum]
MKNNDDTDSSSDEEKNLQGENSKRHKRMCKEIIIEDGKTKVFSKRMSSKENKDTKLLQENVKKYMENVRCWLGTFDTTVKTILVYEEVTIKLRVANYLTNILEPPP